MVKVCIQHTGKATLSNSSSKSFSLNNILHISYIIKNPLPVQKFTHNNNVFFEFHPYQFAVKDHTTRAPILSRPSNNRLYHLFVPLSIHSSRVACVVVKPSSSYSHLLLGGSHQRALNQVLRKNNLPFLILG